MSEIQDIPDPPGAGGSTMQTDYWMASVQRSLNTALSRLNALATQWGVLYSNGTSIIATTAAGAAKSVLTGNGNAAPTFKTTPYVATIAADTVQLVNGSYATNLVSGAVAATRTWTLPLVDGSTGQALTTDGAGTLIFASVGFDPTTTVELYDDFLSYDVASVAGTVLSDTTWAYTSSGAVVPTVVAAGGGAIRLVTDGVDTLSLNGKTPGTLLPYTSAKLPTVIMKLACRTGSASKKFAGLTDAQFSGGVPVNGMYIRWTTAGANYFGVCRAAGAEGTIDLTTAATSGTFVTFKIVVVSASQVDFYVNGTVIGSVTTNIPTVACTVSFGSDSVTLNDGLDLDYVLLRATR